VSASWKFSNKEGEMPVNLKIENLENVEPALRALYIEKDGGFHLDVADLDAHFDTRAAGLKSALQKERETNGMLKKHIGMKPEELHAALTNVAADRVDALVRQYQEKHVAEIALLRNENQTIRDHEHSVIRQTVLDAALLQARATDDGMRLIPELFGNRFRVDGHEGTRSITILEEDGVTPMQIQNADGSKRAAKFGDLLSEAIARFPSQFEGSGGGGGTVQQNQRPVITKTMSRSAFDAMSAHDRAAKMQEGYILHD
jgi:hypothetical protein